MDNPKPRTIWLKGGPWDGRKIDVADDIRVLPVFSCPVVRDPYSPLGSLTVQYVRHTYNAISGRYIGAVSEKG